LWAYENNLAPGHFAHQFPHQVLQQSYTESHFLKIQLFSMPFIPFSKSQFKDDMAKVDLAKRGVQELNKI
jgi:hypothetical protein